MPSFSGPELIILPQLAEGWTWVKLDKVCSYNRYAIKAGPFGSALKKELYVKTGYKVYGQEQVISGNSEYGNYYINAKKYEEMSNYKVMAKDILISLVGTVGRVLVLPEKFQEGIINPRLIKISLNSNVYLSEFFKFFFESTFIKSLYSVMAKGTTMDVLNLALIQELPFPLCSFQEQVEIVRQIEGIFFMIKKTAAEIEKNLEKLEILRQSILKKAFSGTLVSQDPNDEPASVLLERIKAEKQAAKTDSRKRMRKFI